MSDQADQPNIGSWLPLAAVAALVLAVFVTLGSLLQHFVLDGGIDDLDAGSEASLNNWLTVVSTFAAAVAAGLHALVSRKRRSWFAWLAALLAFLSLDDSLLLHERLGGNIGIDHIETVIFAPLYLIVLAIVLRLARESFPRARAYLRSGVLLLVAAVVVDLGSSVTQDLEQEGTEWPQVTRIAIEEGFEVAGWILLSATLLALVCVALLEGGRRSTATGPET